MSLACEEGRMKEVIDGPSSRAHSGKAIHLSHKFAMSSRRDWGNSWPNHVQDGHVVESAGCPRRLRWSIACDQ